MPDFDNIPEVGARVSVEPTAEAFEPVAAPSEPVEVTPAATAAPTEATPEPETADAPAEAAAEPPLAETATEPPAEAPGAQPAVNPEAETLRTALLDTAKALGITETDVTKLPALIQERNAQSADAQAAAQAAALEAQWKKEAAASLEPLALELIGNRLLAEGFESLPQTEEAWEAPENADIKARYFQLKAELEARPEWAQRIQESTAARQAEHQSRIAKVADITAKYPHAAVDLVNGLRDHGATPDFLETVARQTHQQVERAISTINSEFVAAKTELETLRAQVSGHSEAVAKAKSEGLAEGRNAAIEEVKKGLAHPATVGLGAPTPEQAPGYKPQGIGWSTIPTRSN